VCSPQAEFELGHRAVTNAVIYFEEFEQMRQKIHDKLTVALAPQQLSVSDVSAKHANHQHKHELGKTGETHFDVIIVADLFAGRSRMERHRMVYEVLAEEMAGEIHALAITALAPGEEGADAG
jgi:BolA protein